MTKKIAFDYTNALPFVKETELMSIEAQVNAAYEMLHRKSGAGSEFLGWMDWPLNYDREEYPRIK